MPRAFVIPWDAPALRDPVALDNAVASLPSDARWAVRSSADVEDGAERSFAGQFMTLLDVDSGSVATAVAQVVEQSTAVGASAYATRAGAPEQRANIAVLIQEMVDPVAAGVAFTRNPMTGLDEVIVEAVLGSGEALVQDGVTPDRWVRKWGEWRSVPSKSEIPSAVIEEVAKTAKQIERSAARPVDLEWAWDGSTLWWLQVRPITGLERVTFYSNRMAREMLPGLVLPLVWSVNIPLVNGAWIRILDELLGPTGLCPNDLARPFYFRAYFNMGALGRLFRMLGLPAESLELLAGIESDGPERPRFTVTPRILLRLPRATVASLPWLRLESALSRELPRLESEFRAVARLDIESLSSAEVLREVDRLFRLAQGLAYYNILTLLFMSMYNQLLARDLKRRGIAFEDFGVELPEPYSEYEPRAALASLSDMLLTAPASVRAAANAGEVGQLRSDEAAEAFLESFDSFLERYGHFADSGNDFSTVPWRESPEVVLRMASDYRPPATNLLTLEGLREQGQASRVLSMRVRRAARYRGLREAVSSTYTLGYGLFRPLFLRLGRELVATAALERPDDIFLLALDEVRATIEGGLAPADVRALVQERRQEFEAARGVKVPEIVFGDEVAPVETDIAEVLHGIPASKGHHRGRVVKVRSSSDFGRLALGDVLVVSHTDVAWTPLFALAGAVVAESGGFLSHSSIVAREYGIPAVVGVSDAMGLPDGAVVSVDGFAGEVRLVEERAEEAS